MFFTFTSMSNNNPATYRIKRKRGVRRRINIPHETEEKLDYLRIVSGIFLSNAIISTVSTLIANEITVLLTYYAFGIFFMVLYAISYKAYTSWSRYTAYRRVAYKKHNGEEGFIKELRRQHKGCCTSVCATNVLCHYVFWEKTFDAADISSDEEEEGKNEGTNGNIVQKPIHQEKKNLIKKDRTIEHEMRDFDKEDEESEYDSDEEEGETDEHKETTSGNMRLLSIKLSK